MRTALAQMVGNLNKSKGTNNFSSEAYISSVPNQHSTYSGEQPTLLICYTKCVMPERLLSLCTPSWIPFPQDEIKEMILDWCSLTDPKPTSRRDLPIGTHSSWVWISGKLTELYWFRLIAVAARSITPQSIINSVWLGTALLSAKFSTKLDNID